MIGLWHPELRAEAWVTPVLIPEGWVGRDFIGEGGEPQPEPSPMPNVVSGLLSPGPGYVRVRRRLWFKVI